MSLIYGDIWRARKRDDRSRIGTGPSKVEIKQLSEEELQEVIRKYGEPKQPLPKRKKDYKWGDNSARRRRLKTK